MSDQVSLESLMGHECDLVASVETAAKSLPETVQGPNIILSNIRRGGWLQNKNRLKATYVEPHCPEEPFYAEMILC